MKIEKITVEDGIISILFDAYPADDITDIYLDTVDNSENKYSLDPEKHSYIVTSKYVEGNEVTIKVTSILPELDLSAFTVYAGGVVGFYYDDKEIYYKQADLLVKYCDNCLDKELKENVVVFVMRYNLLQYAVANNKLENLISLYKDIARLIKIDTKLNHIIPSNKYISAGGNCKNGVCSIC